MIGLFLLIVVMFFIFVPYKLIPWILVSVFIFILYKNKERVTKILNYLMDKLGQSAPILHDRSCDICRQRIQLESSKDLLDGVICGSCMKTLSPWFTDYANTSIEGIRDHRHYRYENWNQVDHFVHTQLIGGLGPKDVKLALDEPNKRFLISFNEFISGNPDIINISDVKSCVLDIVETQSFTNALRDEDIRIAKEFVKEHWGQDHPQMDSYLSDSKADQHEIYQNGVRVNNPDYGKTRFRRKISYYDFFLIIQVKSPYFKEIKIKLNGQRVSNEDKNGNGEYHYDSYLDVGNRICSALS